MKTTVNFSEFCDAFELRKENFSYGGKRALFDYLEQYEEDTGQEIELDVISLCCGYSEYKTLQEFQDNYGDEYSKIEDIENRTTVIKIDDNAFIIADF